MLGQGLAADIGAAVAFEKGDTLYVPMHDALGNVCLVLDSAGKPLETLRYTAFGQETSGACSKFSPWQYASKRLDQESGFYYFGRRHYDPNVGRWMTPDPLGFEDGLNLYSYVHNSPLTHVDPDGQYGFLITIAVGFLVSHAIDYVLPVAVNYAAQGAGGTAAALLSGTLKGYNMDYSQGLFANDPILGSTEKLGMAIGTLFSLGNPAKLAKAGTVIATAAKRELVNYGTNLASKRFGNACSVTEKTARKLASQTTATCAKTIEKTAEKATTVAAEKGLARVSKGGVGNSLTLSSKSGADLARHLGYLQDYGKEGVKFLQNGRIRYYGQLIPPKTPGKMIGRRYVHEFNPLRGSSRGWMETLDSNLRVRQVRPQLDFGYKTHYLFDITGNLEKIW